MLVATIAAAALLRQVEDGKLALDDRLSRHLPQVRAPGDGFESDNSAFVLAVDRTHRNPRASPPPRATMTRPLGLRRLLRAEK